MKDEFYEEKYGTALYGLNKLNLLMQKQRNRGQDGAGIATVKLDVEPGTKYIHRKRMDGSQSIKRIFDDVYKPFDWLCCLIQSQTDQKIQLCLVT